MYDITIDGVLTYINVRERMAEAIIAYFRHGCGCVVSFIIKPKK